MVLWFSTSDLRSESFGIIRHVHVAGACDIQRALGIERERHAICIYIGVTRRLGVGVVRCVIL